MANYAIVKQKIDDIISNVCALAASGSRIRYYISAFNPSISDKPMEVFKGSNADNSTLEQPQDWYYGDRMAEKFAEQLNTVVSNPSNVKVSVTIKDGGNKEKGHYYITLREEYNDFTMPDHDRAIVPQEQQPQPQQQPQQQPMQGLGSLETLMGIAFGGLAGTQEGSAVNAMFGVRDQLVRNEFERKADLMRQDYERKQTEREINELKESRDNYRKRVEELERQNEAMSREIRDKNDELEDAESRIEELERMKPEASIAGVALTGVGAKIAETLLLRHAGTVGKLFGVEKEAMLGMLTDDLNEQPETPQQAAPTASAPVVVSEATDGTDEEQDSRISSLKVLFNSLSETEQNDFWSVVLFIDEHRDKLHQMAMSIEGQRKKEQEAA